jgi:protein-S-isoprenylcysteine O-methyltransferase Ste14
VNTTASSSIVLAPKTQSAWFSGDGTDGREASPSRLAGKASSMALSEKVDAALVTSGPYQYIRNPIYSGIIVAAIGTMVAISWYWLVIVALMGTYFVYSAIVEEQTMERLFPDTYPEYKRSTKRLIPFIF